MISILIPIGEFPFFVNACLKNIQSSCGVQFRDIDIVFVTSNKIETNLAQALALAAKQFQFRVISAPFDAKWWHMLLLDWAFRHGNLHDWVFVQHCDLFWHEESNWLRLILTAIRDNDPLAVANAGSHSQFLHNGQDMFALEDLMGAYYRPHIVKYNLSFSWGLVKQISLSKEVTSAIEAGIFSFKTLRRASANTQTNDLTVTLNSWLDGTQAITMEFITHWPERVSFVPIARYSDHIEQFFRMASIVYNYGNSVFLDIPYRDKHKLRCLPSYSAITSFLFDKEEYNEHCLPWAILEEFHADFGLDMEKALWWRDRLDCYSAAINVLGLEVKQIRKVECQDKLIWSRLII